MHDLFGKASLLMKVGILIAILTILYGFGLGIMFGEFEGKVEHKLENKAEKVLDTVYKGDMEAINRAVRGSLNYFKRAHIHANGLGMSAVVLITVLFLFCPPSLIRDLSALLLSIGAFGYSSYWMIAGKLSPGLGGIQQAREAVGWYAVLTASLCAVGIFLVLIVFLKTTFIGKSKS